MVGDHISFFQKVLIATFSAPKQQKLDPIYRVHKRTMEISVLRSKLFSWRLLLPFHRQQMLSHLKSDQSNI
jgi:hypothetical protein